MEEQVNRGMESCAMPCFAVCKLKGAGCCYCALPPFYLPSATCFCLSWCKGCMRDSANFYAIIMARDQTHRAFTYLLVSFMHSASPSSFCVGVLMVRTLYHNQLPSPQWPLRELGSSLSQSPYPSDIPRLGLVCMGLLLSEREGYFLGSSSTF